jgi:superfamily II DNA helicase RecQ
LSRRDVTVILPTGSGKSLIYQLAAVVDGGITIVVTPLVSLMQDQVDSLRALGVNAFSLEASAPKEEVSQIFSDALPTGSKKKTRPTVSVGEDGPASASWTQKTARAVLIYVTPERISKSKKFMTRLGIAYEEGNISRFVVDEAVSSRPKVYAMSCSFASRLRMFLGRDSILPLFFILAHTSRSDDDPQHCICSMGHDFRPDYTMLDVLRRHFPSVPIAALTATATEKVAAEIATSLKMRPVVFKSSIDRSNLFYEVRKKGDNVVQDIANLIQSDFRNKCGIIYCLSRRETEAVAADLQSLVGRNCALCYHGEMDALDRKSVYSSWSSGKVQCVVATVAFGLGINKPDGMLVPIWSFSARHSGVAKRC